MGKPPSILKQSYCIYCQREYGTPKKLQAHVERQHPESYAAGSIAEAKLAERIDPGVKLAQREVDHGES